MPFALAFIGALFLVAGVRNTQGDLFTLLKGDFTGDKNFVYFVVAILAIGFTGYIPRFKPISNAFLILVIIVLFLHNGGFFAKFNEAIATTKNASNTATSGGAASGTSTVQETTLPNWSEIFHGAANAPIASTF